MGLRPRRGSMGKEDMERRSPVSPRTSPAGEFFSVQYMKCWVLQDGIPVQGSPLLGVAAEPQRDGKGEIWGSNPISWQRSWLLVGLGAPAAGARSRVSGCSKGWALQPGSSEHLPPLMSISPNEHLPSIYPNGHFPSLHRAVLLQAGTPCWNRGIFFFLSSSPPRYQSAAAPQMARGCCVLGKGHLGFARGRMG